MTADPGQDWRTFAAPVRMDVTPLDRPTSFRAVGRGASLRRHARAPFVAAVVALVACVTLLRMLGLTPDSAASALSPANDQVLGGTVAAPPVHQVLDPVRLAPTVTPPAGVGGWVPLTGTTTRPIRWNPCQPIRYVIAGQPLFAGGNAMLRSAIATVAHDSGLRFEYAGTSDEPPSLDRPSYQPQRYGTQWAPVLVEWTDASHLALLGGDVIGRAGPQAAIVDGQERLVSGAVYLDATDLARLMAAPFGPSQVRGAMLHELGHLVGLGHSSDPNAVMYPTDHPNAGFDASDLRGLAVMGAGPCFSSY